MKYPIKILSAGTIHKGFLTTQGRVLEISNEHFRTEKGWFEKANYTAVNIIILKNNTRILCTEELDFLIDRTEIEGGEFLCIALGYGHRSGYSYLGVLPNKKRANKLKMNNDFKSTKRKEYFLNNKF